MGEQEITGYQRDRSRATVAGNTAEVSFTAGPGEIQEYDRLAIRSTSTVLTSILRVYVGSATDDNLVDGSDSGNLDIADNNSPIRVGPGETIRFVWTNADNGAICSVNAQRKTREVVTKRRRSYDPHVLADVLPGRVFPQSVKRNKVRQPFGGGW